MRIVFGEKRALGPGKADLLTAIATHGSIAAAGRAMGMSYQRAWSLVDELNAMFREPLVSSSRGGSSRGGAALTEVGKLVLDRYRAIEDATASMCENQLDEIASLTRQESDISGHR
jgi:molybdate transport system regulatory protein